MEVLELRQARLVPASALQRLHVFRQTGLGDERLWQEQMAVVLLLGVPLLGHRLGLALLDLALTVAERLHGSHNLGHKRRTVVQAT